MSSEGTPFDEAPEKSGASIVFQTGPESLELAVSLLQEGQLVALPTETVYGLGAVGTNPDACRKIFEVKGRPLMDPLILHVTDRQMAKDLAHWNPVAEKLAQTFWPGALTLVLPRKRKVPDIVTAGRETVALRSPAHPTMRKVLECLNQPVAAPSANPFMYVSPTKASHVEESLGDRIPMILDGGDCEIGLESTILSLAEPETPRLLRPGSISRTALENLLGIQIIEEKKNTGEAPGMMERHYSPGKPISLFQGSVPENDAKGIGWVFLKRPQKLPKQAEAFWLSERGSMEEVARNLYDLLRILDQTPLKEVWVEEPSGEGIALAIQDRLRRAASKK